MGVRPRAALFAPGGVRDRLVRRRAHVPHADRRLGGRAADDGHGADVARRAMLLTLGLVGTAVSVVLWFTAVTLIIQPGPMAPWAAGVYTALTSHSRPRAVVA